MVTEAKPIQWEYLTKTLMAGQSTKRFDKLGAQGWELVGIDSQPPFTRYTFKRIVAHTPKTKRFFR